MNIVWGYVNIVLILLSFLVSLNHWLKMVDSVLPSHISHNPMTKYRTYHYMACLSTLRGQYSMECLFVQLPFHSYSIWIRSCHQFLLIGNFLLRIYLLILYLYGRCSFYVMFSMRESSVLLIAICHLMEFAACVCGNLQ